MSETHLPVPLLPAGTSWREHQPDCDFWITSVQELSAEAAAWARYLDVPLKASDYRRPCSEGRAYELNFSGDGVSIIPRHDKAPGPVLADLAGPAARYRRAHGGGRGEMVCRAVGLRRGVDSLRVLDATAGLGGDAMVLASAGCRVQMLERHPVVYLLLMDGLRRLRESEPEAGWEERLTLDYGGFNQSRTEYRGFDVIYLDPMFPGRKKKSQVKKAMQVFQDLVGKDPDADLLLQPALDSGARRVVVKRPKLAPYLSDTRPSTSLQGKSCRYDIYPLASLVQV